MISSASNLTQSKITVRPLQRAECSLMLEIIHAAYVEYEGKLTPPSGAHDETMESLATKLIHGEGALAWDGTVAVGSVLFEPRGEALYLGRLAVPPQHRRRGIGARLAAYVEAQAMARGHNQITLGVRLQLPENTLFYTKLGYHIASYDSHPGFSQPTYMNMVKKLDL